MFDTSPWPGLCKICGRIHVKFNICPKDYKPRIPKQSPKKRAYDAVHKWASRKMVKTGACTNCNKAGRTHWSNIDHKYERLPEKWQELCPKCHEDFDYKHNGKLRRPKTNKALG